MCGTKRRCKHFGIYSYRFAYEVWTIPAGGSEWFSPRTVHLFDRKVDGLTFRIKTTDQVVKLFQRRVDISWLMERSDALVDHRKPRCMKLEMALHGNEVRARRAWQVDHHAGKREVLRRFDLAA